ncbi:sensor histidine kinase [Citreimonas sp.]|uniref:sensor histidine kinase n=1 Tax=Citreimonas sp. TaxID=3036715 RepID=UPI004058990D
MLEVDKRKGGCVGLKQQACKRRPASQELLLQEKMRSIGYMTTSVIHDFNNLLAVLSSGTRLLRCAREGQRGRDGRQERILEEMDSAVDMAKRLVNELLAFAQDQDVNLIRFCPDQRINTISGILRRIVNTAVEVELSLEAPNATIEACQAMFDAALINMSVNSSHAMPEGGKLQISTRVLPISVNDNPVECSYVSMRIADTGVGISPENLRTVFEPFFTSKGKYGNGMGLYQVREFTLQSNGDIRIDSNVGSGTVVEIRLPVVCE